MGEMCLNGNVTPNYRVPHLRTIYSAPKNVSFITGVLEIFPLSDFQMDFRSAPFLTAVLTQLQFTHQLLIEMRSQLMQAK